MKFSKKQLVILSIIFIATILVALICITLFTNRPNQEAATLSESTALLKTSEENINLEIADSEEEKVQGLMNRTYLDRNAGMLFIFEDSKPRTFWMQNTLIPLDIIYLDEDLNVVKVYTNTKTNQISEVYYSIFPSKFAIELNAGTLERLKIKEGDTLNIQY